MDALSPLPLHRLITPSSLSGVVFIQLQRMVISFSLKEASKIVSTPEGLYCSRSIVTSQLGAE